MGTGTKIEKTGMDQNMEKLQWEQPQIEEITIGIATTSSPEAPGGGW